MKQTIALFLLLTLLSAGAFAQRILIGSRPVIPNLNPGQFGLSLDSVSGVLVRTDKTNTSVAIPTGMSIASLRQSLIGMSRVHINDVGRSGDFFIDFVDTSSPDDGAMTLVAANGARYKRDTPVLRPEFWDANGFTDATVNLQKAVNYFSSSTNRRPLALSGVYSVTSTITVRGKTGGQIVGNAGLISITGGGSGLRLVNCSNLEVTTVRFLGTGRATSQATGIQIDSSSLIRINACLFEKLKYSVYSDYASVITVYGSNRVSGCTMYDCQYGIYIDKLAEYMTLETNNIYACVTAIFVGAGNVKVLGNTIVDNFFGIDVLGSETQYNTDHGRIDGNTCNHNYYFGIRVQHTRYAMAITNNEIWAQLGPAGANDPLPPYDSQYGAIFIDVENINFSNNTLGHNRTNLGLDGYYGCLINDNVFKVEPNNTVSHVRELGSSQTSTGGNFNLRNTFEGNEFYGTFVGGRVAMIDFLTDGRSRSYKIVGNTSSVAQQAVTLTSSNTGVYIYDGLQAVTIRGDHTGSVEVNSVMMESPFSILYDANGTSSTHQIATRGATLKSLVQSATVSAGAIGNVLSLSATGLYTFTPDGASSFIVTMASGPVSVSSGPGSGDMSRSTYDTDNSNTVDNSERLGGNLPAFYATSSGLNSVTANIVSVSTLAGTANSTANSATATGATNSAAISSLSGTVGTHTGQISSLSTTAGQALSTANSATAGVGSLSTTVTTHTTQITSLSAGKVDATAFNSFTTSNTTAIAGKAPQSGSSDIEITDPTKGIILRSPNGTRYRITVSDIGTLTTTAL